MIAHTAQVTLSCTCCAALACSSNKLQQLPRGISALSALKLLDVSDNTLSRLPDELAALPALAKLSCSNCKLVALPDAVGVQQPSLSAVQASGNSLTSLPAGLASASALVMLDLSNNQLTDITGVAALQLLRELDVSHNKLEVCFDSGACNVIDNDPQKPHAEAADSNHAHSSSALSLHNQLHRSNQQMVV